MNKTQLRDAIFAFGEAQNLLPSLTWEHEMAGLATHDKPLAETLVKDTKELLQVLLSRSWKEKSVTPPIKASEQLHECVANFVFFHLSQSQTFQPQQTTTVDGLLSHLKATNYSDPERCFWGVAGYLGIRDAVELRDRDEGSTPKQRGLSWLEPSIWRYITSPEGEKRHDPPDDLDTHIEDVRTTLGYRGKSSANHRPIAVLSGPAHSGKKSIVGDFFKRIAISQSADAIRFQCFWGSDGNRADLPVLCIQTRNRDYISLCIEVLVFLERANEAQRGITPQPQEDVVRARWAVLDHLGGAPVLQLLLDRIGELHRDTPALFVFLDVRHAPFADIRNLIRRYGIRRLVETLVKSGRDSRFFITTDKVSDGDFLAAFRPQRFKLNRPTCERIRWYLSDSKKAAFESSAKAQGFDNFKDKEIDGDVLMSMAVLFAHSDGMDTEFFDLFRVIANSKGSGDSKPIEQVCRRLLDIWDKEQLVPFIALISASEDGMMTPTIEACMKEWISSEPGLQVAGLSHGLNRLTDLSQLGRGLFLQHQVPPNFTEEETRFDEPSFAEKPDHFRTWELDAVFSSVFRRLLARDSKHIATLRQAYRLIAGQARSRALFRQIKGMMPQRSFGPQLPERSVQAFVALLLSLEPDSINDIGSGEMESNGAIGSTVKDANPAALPMATRRVFELRRRFDQNTAIRYAYYVLLKSEADQDHRLSMTMDADLLRLHLYTLLCANPGTLLHWDHDQYQQNRNALPPAIQEATLAHLKVFSTETQAELLSGLSMAAFYAGHYAILIWAEEQLFGLLPFSPAVADHLSRAVSARVDLEIQIGRPLRPQGIRTPSSLDRLDEQKYLAAVRHILAEDILRICSNITDSLDLHQDTASVDPAELSAWLRLQARAIYLDDLLDPDAKTAARLGELRMCELTFLRDRNSPRSLSQHGRTGRLNMKSLLEHFPLLSSRYGQEWKMPLDRPDLLEHIDSMIHANVSRLSRFSGSERALTLIDHARQLMLQGNPTAALGAVQEARRICFLGTSSDNIRLEVLMLETLILLALAEGMDPESVGGTRDSEKVLEDVKMNLVFVDRIIAEYGLEFEKITRNVLVWRAQTVANAWSVKSGLFPRGPSIEDAVALAELHGAFGLLAKLEKLRSRQL